MFYDPSRFPFVATLEANWRAIRDEITAVQSADFQNWDGNAFTGDDNKWTVFPLYNGIQPDRPIERSDENCRRCPVTTEVVESISGLRSAGFSRLEPHKWIKPHRDLGHVLRCHLGLTVPPRCGLRVCGETRRWQEGKCMVANTDRVHDAWNLSDRDRIILLVDVFPSALDIDLDECAEAPPTWAPLLGAWQHAHYRLGRAGQRVRRRLARA